MNKTHKTIALAIGSAFALSIAASSVNAAENPFAIKSLASGYQVADNDTKMKDGKCSTGNCGASKKAAMEKAAHKDKTKEGSCSAAKMKDGACSAEMKKGAEEKMKESTAK